MDLQIRRSSLAQGSLHRQRCRFSSRSSRRTLPSRSSLLSLTSSRIRRSRGEIDPAGIGGEIAHLAKHESAVGGHQRRHGEAIADLGVGEAEIAPGEKSLVFDLGRRAAQDAPTAVNLDAPLEVKKDAAIEEMRIFRGKLVPNDDRWRPSHRLQIANPWPRPQCRCRRFLRRARH